MKIGRIGSAEESVMVCQEFAVVFFERTLCERYRRTMCDDRNCEGGCVRRNVATQKCDAKQEFTGQWCRMSEERSNVFVMKAMGEMK